jgi:hypothetical protein
MTKGLSFGGACMDIGELHESLEGTKNSMEELLVVLDNIVRACFKLFFKLA